MSIATEVAKLFIARAASQHMTRGAKRDRAALEFCCGAGSAIIVRARTDVTAKADQHALELLAFMVATRGYAYLEEIANNAEG